MCLFSDSFFPNCLFFFWLWCVFIAVHGLSLVAESRGYSLAAEHGPRGGCFCCGAGTQEHGLSWPTACGIFPDQGSEPVSPALTGRFLTTGPPGMSWLFSVRIIAPQGSGLCSFHYWSPVPRTVPIHGSQCWWMKDRTWFLRSLSAVLLLMWRFYILSYIVIASLS